MLNIHPEVLCTSEEPFAIYFYNRYKTKTTWTTKELQAYVDEFWQMAEKNLELFYSSKEQLYNALLPFKENLSYKNLLKLTYLQFLEPKPKEGITCIVDKQIKYFFYLPLLCEIFPEAKFVILVRDVRDNIVSKSNHRLNSSANGVFLSALWYYTYRNVEILTSLKKDVHIVKYEDMVSAPEQVVKSVCAFYGISYQSSMIRTEGYYERFLEARRPFVSPEFLEYLTRFQSSLFSGVNTKKIGVHKKSLDPTIEAKVVKLNRQLFDRFGYTYPAGEEARFSLSDRWQIFRAYLYRPFLLTWYGKIPFTCKLLIKKIRRTKHKPISVSA